MSFSPPATSGDGSSISGYTVTATDTTTPANGGQTASGSSSPITVSGLTDGDAYTFTVTATNASGTSLASSASSAVTPLGVPGAPTGVSGTSQRQRPVGRELDGPGGHERLGHHLLQGDGHRHHHAGQRRPDLHVHHPDPAAGHDHLLVHGHRPDQR